MKNITRLLSVFVAAAMLFGMLSAMSLGVSAETKITKVEITGVVEPIDGAAPVKSCNSTAEYTAYNVGWWDYANKKWMTTDDTFTAGNNYIAIVYIKPKEGYAFASPSAVTATVNGMKASFEGVYGKDDEFAVSIDLTCVKRKIETIDKVAVTNVKVPVDGEKASATGTAYETTYCINSMSWYDEKGNKLESVSTFSAGQTYTARFYLVPSEGAAFAAASDMTATVNGEEAEILSVYGEPNRRGVVMKYTCVTAVKDIAITFAVPAANAKVTSPKVETEGVRLDEFYWFDEEYNEYKVGDTFAADKTYTCQVHLKPEEGYVISENAKVTFGGEPAAYYASPSISADKCAVADSRQYKTSSTSSGVGTGEGVQIILAVAVEGIDSPKIGEKPDTTATALDAGYTVSAVKWTVGEDELPMDTETFEEDKVYTVNIELTALGDSRVFADTASASLNGEYALIAYEPETPNKLVVYNTYPVMKNEVIAEIAVEAESPAIGKTPDTAVTISSDDYAVEEVVWAEGDSPLKEGETFKSGKTYSVTVILTAAVGKAFSVDTVATVCGKAAEIDFAAENPKTIAIRYTFPKLTSGSSSGGSGGGSGSGFGEYKFPFTDVADSAWYRKDVEIAHKNGLVNGKTATLFYPDDNMTYAEAVKLASAMHELYHYKKVTLKSGELTWYSTYMEYALEKGIIEEDLTGIADEKITRRDFVKIFYAALPASEYTVINEVADGAIPDVASSDESAKQIYAFYRAGILTGSDGYGTFYPKNNIVRREVAAILTRMFDKSARKAITLK